MDIRHLTDTYAVSPQITPDDVADIAEAGFTTVICNRPDGEIPPEVQADAIGRAVEEAGLRFIINPVIGGAITMENVTAQGAALTGSDGPVLAYCASGNRSSIVWALSQAGQRPTDELIEIPARFGYALEPFRPTLEQLARG
ncbi:TIGR01244 family sulfur transferase [Roseinatronobacter alkalisoli]|uniref:TIGR01244 family sulfur transferase n=1 Tax=Roseinatronobacter alkalisoli TaxID=3028235 RepID=A0ABT5TDY0_9RHOB|nr:TIGR01244 family sulfur transferase [Roseinatronobacter sp. HJB301]MDD7973328.1 TIGR01244 family sulfur transferase [Roseinatronobacter sp. HJB301]